jgi:hypothetical protein
MGGAYFTVGLGFGLGLKIILKVNNLFTGAQKKSWEDGENGHGN